MNTTVSTRKKRTVYNDTIWARHLESQKASGLDRAAYCRQHALDYKQFNYWLYERASRTTSLVTVKIKPDEHLPEKKLGILHLKNGCLLDIHDKQALLFILERC